LCFEVNGHRHLDVKEGCYCNCLAPPAGLRRQARDSEQHAFQAPACVTERAPDFIGFVVLVPTNHHLCHHQPPL